MKDLDSMIDEVAEGLVEEPQAEEASIVKKVAKVTRKKKEQSPSVAQSKIDLSKYHPKFHKFLGAQKDDK